MTSDEPIAVTGVTGGVGGRVARRLARAGAATRLLVRDPDRAPDLPGAEVARASFHEPATVAGSTRGAGTLLLVSASEDADRVGLHTRTVDAACDAGVTRIVYVSFLAAAPDATFTFARDHWHTEQHIRGTGVAYTFLRDSLYQDILPYFAGPDGVIRGPGGDGRVAAVTRDDIADVAAAVLLAGAGSDHDGRTYDVTGPEALRLADVAAELTRAAGRPVRYQAETMAEAYASRARFGASEWEVTGWVTSYAAVASGELDLVSDTVATVAGHEPVRFADFLAANPQTLDHLRPAAGG